MSKTIEERLASIETTLEIIPALDSKVDQLLLDQARDEGEKKAIRRLSGVVAAVVSIAISLACNLMF